MVLNIIDYIGEKLLASNPWLEAFAANCIKLKGGEIVNFIGEEKKNFSPSDIVGIAAYVRLDPTITYTESTKKFSCDKNLNASMKFRLVLFQIDRMPKLHPVKTENKIWGDLNDINFDGFTGNESNIVLSVNSSNLNFYDNFVAEVSKEYTIPVDSIIIALNCTLTWEAAKDNCESECDVYEDPESC